MLRRSAVVAASMVAWIVVAACSNVGDRPPADGDCVATEAGRCSSPVVGIGVGVGVGTSADGGTTCEVDGGSAQCDQCIATSCCTEITTCESDTPCANLLSCEDGCNASVSCLTDCQNEFPTGVGDLQAIVTCETTRCTVCNQSGVGDPCGEAFAPCASGLTCNGLWCTKPCANPSDCTGLGAGGTNELGLPNTCVHGSAGDTCVPECVSSTDCVDFPGTFCFSTIAIDATTVSVCTGLPDASDQ